MQLAFAFHESCSVLNWNTEGRSQSDSQMSLSSREVVYEPVQKVRSTGQLYALNLECVQ